MIEGDCPDKVAFVESLGCYAKVLAYDDIEALDAGVATVFVDIAGDAAVRGRVHRHFNPSLKYSCAVGATHWQEGGGGGDLPGPKPELFFAPAQIGKRIAEWGAQAFGEKVAGAWRAFLPIAARTTKIVERDGLDGAEAAFAAFVAGTASADEGYVIRLG